VRWGLKEAVEQSLMLRGSRDFSTREEYALFLRELLEQLNSGRRERFEEELKKWLFRNLRT